MDREYDFDTDAWDPANGPFVVQTPDAPAVQTIQEHLEERDGVELELTSYDYGLAAMVIHVRGVDVAELKDELYDAPLPEWVRIQIKPYEVWEEEVMR